MTTNPSLPPGIHKEKQIVLEIGNSEKQLWALIHSKGLLHIDAQDLYQKVRSSYERTILNNRTHSELQDVEYSLWKLHYKHIDEFRKRIKKGSGNAENKKSGTPQNGLVLKNNDNHLKAFKSFLSEATEFYQNLIVKVRKHYGVPEEALFYKRGCISTSVEPDAMLKCQYLCHRCLVCMGDLARYEQQCESPDIHNHNWSVAATLYLEATRIWPDSGNPQNQLAVLATYIGDEFLALYHCVRSLAVKKPFPDAWDNLILLFEKNRSSHLHYISSEVCFDPFKPFGRREQTKAQPKDDISNCNTFKGQSNRFADTELWSLMVRTISFFFIKSSLEEFPIVFASTTRELDKMMELEDMKLKAMLESYEQMDLARRGPFRAIQVVSVLIFVLKHLIDNLEKDELKDKNESQQLVLIQLALYATFSFLGRFVERCLKAGPLHSCPLLPSVLVFVEWTANMLDATEVYATDQKSRGAMSYFFGVFVDLLNQLNAYRRESKDLLDSTPLWEDYELRGFEPVTCAHISLDFSGNWEHIDNFESGIELRTLRISKAAVKIASRSNDLQKRIICDELGMKFYVARLDKSHDKQETENVESRSTSTKGEDSDQQMHKGTEEHDRRITGNNPSNSSTNEKSTAVEDEEVILFRPLTRYNSAPSYPSISTNEQISPKDKDDQSLPSDDCLRRATSLLMAQNPTQSNPSGFHADIANFRGNKSFKQVEPLMKESNAHTFSEGSISAGPPSLNAWVLDRASLINNRDKGTNSVSEHRLQPIEEIASSSLAGLSIQKSEHSIIGSANQSSNFYPSSASYSVPVPSAPLLPDNAAWFTDVQSTLYTPLVPDNPSPISGYSDWSSTYGTLGYGHSFPAFTNGYPPPRRMTSSEWLRWYRENYNPERVNSHKQPTHNNAPGNPENFLYHDTHRFIQFDRWGNPLPSKQYTYMEPPGPPPFQPSFPSAIGEGEHINCLFNNFQRSSPFGCGAVTDLRNEPQPLLEHLKEKEWRLQRDPTLTESTFMGN